MQMYAGCLLQARALLPFYRHSEITDAVVISPVEASIVSLLQFAAVLSARIKSSSFTMVYVAGFFQLALPINTKNFFN
jgi:hypothetical protein